MADWGFGFAFDMELEEPLDFFDVVYKNGEKVRYERVNKELNSEIEKEGDSNS